MTGYSRIEPTGITFDYPNVDLDSKLVTARVLFQDELIMEVVIDVKHDTVQQRGSLEEIAHITTYNGINRMTEDMYINSLKRTAKFFVDNKISNPKSYYDELENQ
ncbi:hypothetical protein ACK8P5_05385 [Paenibacillus sp. EC2-1]|uniref:hypothetical protein n=1 Tax=Paenibacillus sp. EC2-1 TaxID=3388665 RepID=UPI003BEF446E